LRREGGAARHGGQSPAKASSTGAKNHRRNFLKFEVRKVLDKRRNARHNLISLLITDRRRKQSSKSAKNSEVLAVLFNKQQPISVGV
jgi:hypothetical protein